MFSETEQEAIQEKLEQLRKVKNHVLTPKELSDIITKRRVSGAKEILDEMLVKYKGLSPEEQAHRIVYLEFMKINPVFSKVSRISPNKIKIESYNFCPYLEACQQLGFDTRYICKETAEDSMHKMIKLINPNLKFSRNYENIRPYSNFCEEYIELLEHEKVRTSIVLENVCEA